MKSLRYVLEAVLVRGLALLFSCLPVQRASNLGGWIGRTIGPRLSASRKAIRHLQAAFPETSDPDAKEIIMKMWDNLGRVFAEYPHLEKLGANAEVQGIENLEDCLKHNKTLIMFSGHLANWEVMAVTLHHRNLPMGLVYRAPNNPYVHGILEKYRTLKGKMLSFPKSSRGTRDMTKAMKNGRSIGILIDQKYNQGIETQFFGMPAMTSPAFVKLAQKNHLSLLPVQTERLDGIKFRVTYHTPVRLHEADGHLRDEMDIINEAQSMLERWIAERPDQWLWIHRRWLSERDKQKRLAREAVRESEREDRKSR